MGCSALFNEVHNEMIPVVFALNGSQVGDTSMKYDPDHSKLYPYIGMANDGISVLFRVRTR